MKSKLGLCLGIVLFSVFSSLSAEISENVLWRVIDQSSHTISSQKGSLAKKTVLPVYQNALLIELNQQLMINRLQSARKPVSLEAKSAISSKFISLPLLLPNGNKIVVKLIPDEVLPSALADKFPGISTFKILPEKNIFAGRVDLTPNGFHAILNMVDGETILIDPVDIASSLYASYRKSDQEAGSYRQFSCAVSDFQMHAEEDVHDQSSPVIANKTAARSPESLLNYRIAIAATGEYTVKHGGTVEGALAAITTSLNRVNLVMERDLGIHLSLVENNHLLISTDPDSDPFTKTDLVELVTENQAFIDTVIGTDNYDLGHLFTTKGGGLAAIASACNSYRKAQGVSGISNPVSDSFDLDFVAHEIGHQLGATHTFNSSQGLCSGNTRTARTAFEPGSGSSIMSYAGYCGLDNLQSNTDAMYHIGSIQQINDYTSSGQGNACGERTTVSNLAPLPDAGNDAIIPSRTPFELTGNASDADGDTLIFAWEQLDAGETSAEYTDKGDNALFRVHNPDNNNYRSFPPLTDILNHSSSKGETLPEQRRSMRFAFVAQDGYNIAQSDEMTIQVERTGSRFALNLPKSQYTLGETYQVFWNVANTDQAPINCQNVDISLSINGGYHFNHVLAENSPNTGSAWITIPVDSAIGNRGRFKLKCSDNIFFAVSYRDFVITDKTTSVTYKYNDEDQPEPELKDTDIDVIAVVNNVANDISGVVSDSSGGAFDFCLFFLSLLLIRKTRILNKGT